MLEGLQALYIREIKRVYRSVYMWIMIISQPVIWVVFFGSSFSHVPSQFLETFFHTSNYIAYILPGELSVSMLTVGMFSSNSLIQDKRFGYMKRVFITPVPKYYVFLAKVFGGITRGLIQVPILLSVALGLGVPLNINVVSIVTLVLALVFVGMGFSSLYAILTLRTADWQAPGVISNLLNLPLMFSSTALFPRTFFPTWLTYISDVNPISYSAELGRQVLMTSDPNWTYLGILGLFALIMVILGGYLTNEYMQAE